VTPGGTPPDEDALREIYRDDYVARYHQSAGTRLERVVDLADLDAGLDVVDFACGSGLLHDLLADRVARYTGVDFSREFIEEARRRQRRGSAETRFVCQSIADFCEENPSRFDRAFAMDVTEHVPDAELLEILRAIRGSLAPGGQLYVHTPDGDFALEILKARGWLEQVEGHVAVRNARENRRLLEAAGFRDVQVVSLPHYLPALSWLHALRVLPVLGRHFGARIFIRCLA
jgi:2-polyprenyl-3-methyl-5-hydroxy-6-metoxy-1,4-benzoquinol methylase